MGEGHTEHRTLFYLLNLNLVPTSPSSSAWTWAVQFPAEQFVTSVAKKGAKAPPPNQAI